jgi:hypothetical protein
MNKTHSFSRNVCELHSLEEVPQFQCIYTQTKLLLIISVNFGVTGQILIRG